ncbi:hypothetical protein AAG570_005746 [Ranatra chinensis]|uniref:Uncharacterized protein n=1 Tax=Ranatra chinensis TaxID=642074 RepID=A0ABD0XYF4_9HEMI
MKIPCEEGASAKALFPPKSSALTNGGFAFGSRQDEDGLLVCPSGPAVPSGMPHCGPLQCGLKYIHVGLNQTIREGARANLFSEAKEEAQKVLKEVGGLLDRSEDLLQLVETATAVHKEAVTGPFGMDLEACENVTTSLMNAQLLVVNTLRSGYGAFKNITNSLNDLLNCPGLNPIKSVTCMMDDIKTLKASVDIIKPMVADFRVKIENSYVEIHGEVLDCIGFESKP